MACQTHNLVFGFNSQEGLIGGMTIDLDNNIKYLLDMEFVIKSVDRNNVNTIFALQGVKTERVDFDKPIDVLPTAYGPDIELKPMLACEKCGDKLLDEDEKLFSHHLFKLHIENLHTGKGETVEGYSPHKKPDDDNSTESSALYQYNENKSIDDSWDDGWEDI